MKYIHRVGIELEGAFFTRYWNTTQGHYYEDGSVDIYIDDDETENIPFVGEFVSPPLSPAKINKWISRHYPDKYNESCGLHVHVSFKSLTSYHKILKPQFQKTIISELKTWAKDKFPDLNHRLSGRNEFCTFKYKPMYQLFEKYKNSQRYTAVNYCYELHKTVEFRILPMMPTETHAIAAVQKLLELTEQYISKQKRLKKIKVTIKRKDIKQCV